MMLITTARDVWRNLRSFVRDPLFAGVAVLTIGLGVGASTAVFTLISSSALRPLPVVEPESLAWLFRGDDRHWTHPLWGELERRIDRFGGGFASSRTAFDVAASGESRFIEGLWASGGFFETLGVSPSRGRLFTEADDRPGCGAAGPVAVISHRLWRSHKTDAPPFPAGRRVIGARRWLSRSFAPIPAGMATSSIARRQVRSIVSASVND